MRDNPYHTPSYPVDPDSASLRLQFQLEAPIKTLTEANTYEHWTKRSKRHKQQQAILRMVWPKNAQITLPCVICVERLSVRKLDSGNLAMSLKWIQDEVGALLFPEKVITYRKKSGTYATNKGFTDNNPQVQWIYRQSKAKIQGIRITIWGNP